MTIKFCTLWSVLDVDFKAAFSLYCKHLSVIDSRHCSIQDTFRKGYYCNLKKKRCEKLRRLGKPCKKSDECSNGHCLPSVFSTSRLYGQIQGRIRLVYKLKVDENDLI